MTRILTIIALVFVPTLLAGCGGRIHSADPLPQNDWAQPDSNGNLFVKLNRWDNTEAAKALPRKTRMSEYAPEELTIAITSYTETCQFCSKAQRQIQMQWLNWMDIDRCADNLEVEERSKSATKTGWVDGKLVSLYGSNDYEVNVIKKRVASVTIGNNLGINARYENGSLKYTANKNLFHTHEYSNDLVSGLFHNDADIVYVNLVDYCNNEAVYEIRK